MQDTHSGKVEFRPPANFRSPENVEAGKDWDMVCSFRTQSDGSLCMTKLGDTPMPGYDKDDHDSDRDADHKPGYQKLSSGIMNEMGASGAQQSQS
jgi:hypothetical protein